MLTPTTDDAAARRVVIVVRHGTRRSSRSRLFLNYEDYDAPDAPMSIDYYLWVVRDAERQVIVDLGYSRRAAQERGREITVDPLAALRELGVDPPGFDGDIVLTHAHWDHTGHIADFPLARFVISAAEYRFWSSPESAPHLLRHLADEQDLAALRAAHADGRVLLVDPPFELAPGIRLVPGPGHTPGLLMVDVDTAAGPVLLASDAVHFDEELARDMPFRHMVDLVASYATFGRIRDASATVIAGHEPGVIERYPRLPGALNTVACVVGAPDEKDRSHEL